MTLQSYPTQFIGYPTNNIVEMKNKNQCLLPVFMTAIVLLFCSAQLWAQSSDTLFVIEEEFVYDTLFVHDTLHIHDTITIDEYIHSPEFEQLFYNSEFIDSQTFPDSLKKIFTETVTFWENNVFDSKQEKFSSMDSIKKYGLAALIFIGLNVNMFAQKDSSSCQKNVQDMPSSSHSVGLINGFSLLPGVTYKYQHSQHFSLETDINSKILITGRLLSEKANHIVLGMVELSENFLYQHPFAKKNNISYQYIFGGGVSGAIQPISPIIWKIGVNAFAGIEFVLLEQPISFQVDVRPGYGLLLRFAKTVEEQRHYLDLLTPGLNHNPQSCFDWALNFSIRFHKKNKYNE